MKKEMKRIPVIVARANKVLAFTKRILDRDQFAYKNYFFTFVYNSSLNIPLCLLFEIILYFVLHMKKILQAPFAKKFVLAGTKKFREVWIIYDSWFS